LTAVAALTVEDDVSSVTLDGIVLLLRQVGDTKSEQSAAAVTALPV